MKKNIPFRNAVWIGAFVLVLVSGHTSVAQDTHQQDLAKASQNPLATMISLPFQNNTNVNLGPNDRVQNVLNIQPVIPISGGKWNGINRSISLFY